MRVLRTIKQLFTQRDKDAEAERRATEARIRRETHDAATRVHFLEVSAELMRRGALPKKPPEPKEPE